MGEAKDEQTASFDNQVKAREPVTHNTSYADREAYEQQSHQEGSSEENGDTSSAHLSATTRTLKPPSHEESPSANTSTAPIQLSGRLQAFAQLKAAMVEKQKFAAMVAKPNSFSDFKKSFSGTNPDEQQPGHGNKRDDYEDSDKSQNTNTSFDVMAHIGAMDHSLNPPTQ